MGLFSSASGLDKLAERYPATREPDWIQRKKTAMIGSVRFRNCCDIGLETEGLYIAINAPMGKAKPMLISWSQLKIAGKTKIYWETATTLSVSEPEIARISIPDVLFSYFKPYLKAVGNLS